MAKLVLFSTACPWPCEKVAGGQVRVQGQYHKNTELFKIKQRLLANVLVQ